MSALQNAKTPASIEDLPKAPLASSFPAYPASWYLFCHTTDLRHGPLSKRILGRDLVAFRAESGRVAVLNARCSHLGANLGCGRVVGESIQCPFHHWKYGADGRCTHVPGAAQIPPFASQESYPTVARHGYLFFFNGSEPLFPLPFFHEEHAKQFTAGRVFAFVAHASWFMMAAQGFDTQHFEAVHDRRLLRPPEVDSPNTFARRNRYHAAIVSLSIRDHILRLVAGPLVTVTITNWGGTMFAVKAEFPRTCSRFLVAYRPLEDGRTFCEVIVFARRGLPSLGLPLRCWFTRAHLVAEAAKVRDTEYRPTRFIGADADMVECFQWLARLPQRAPSANRIPQTSNQTTTNERAISSIP